ncbi:hypothetical protein B0H17DRAFT_928851 [Mycena rosella]|uniref:N-acetyltransferase domain-containing protein n=1 Tax=Mycena rosella TaxID=1033263 RepID=A0AAD7DPZ7_MYCRO|nr:hypothetical protein B0H17DRAFT_928851 [Mycena rosella]
MTTAPAPTPTLTAADIPDRFTVDSAELQAEVSARTPILFRADGEPYIPLPAPFERFYLGVMRHWDTPHDVAMMNDIRVARTLVGPPFPLPVRASKNWLLKERRDVTAIFAAYAEGKFLPAGTAPFSILRELKPDGSEVYVGQVTVFYCGDDTKRLTPVNAAWEEWRTRTKVWEIGAAIHPDYQRTGLATAAVDVFMHQWVIPQMGATELRAQCFASNLGSVKLWQKYGFVEEPSLRGEVTVSEAKGGGVEPDMTLIWHLK